MIITSVCSLFVTNCKIEDESYGLFVLDNLIVSDCCDDYKYNYSNMFVGKDCYYRGCSVL
jgi:hypothetical protein